MKYDRIDWLQVGKNHWQDKQEEIIDYCEHMEWKTLPCEMGFMPGEAIKTLIRELKLPKVSGVGYSHELAPYSLIGIEAHYKNSDIQFFAVDEGSHISPICIFVKVRD